MLELGYSAKIRIKLAPNRQSSILSSFRHLTSYARNKSNQTFKCIYEYLDKRFEMQRPNIFHFKALGMMNLHYEIRICQKIYNRVTMTVYVKCVVRFNLNKTLFCHFEPFEA